MAKQFISELKTNNLVNTHFLVKKKLLRDFTNKQGKYLSLELADKTGSIDGKLWDSAEKIFTTFEEKDVVFVQGKVESYNNTKQIIINTIKKYDDYSLEDYLLKGKKDTEELFAYLQQVVKSIQNPYLQKLLICFFDDTQFVKQFKESPSASSIHHAYLGGLIEHSVETLKICDSVCSLYPQIDRDILFTGAILHDIGKIKELECGLTFDYTDEGRLLGHLIMGEQMVSEKIATIDNFPSQIRLKVLHMILSHHGEYEWGSPKRPKTIEAFALHYADLLGTRVNQFAQLIEKDSDKDWTEYSKSLNRAVYKG